MRVGLDVQASFHSYFWGCMVGDGSYKRSGGGGGELGKQRTGTTIVLHFLNMAPVVEYLLMSLS